MTTRLAAPPAAAPAKPTLSAKPEKHFAVFIPGGGTEKYSNVGKTHFTEVLVEVKRPRGPGQEQPAFETGAELAGRPPMPGIVNLLDNCRVRVSETVVEPGASSGLYQQPNDASRYMC